MNKKGRKAVKMLPKTTPQQDNVDKARLEQILDNKHPLYQLANSIEWTVFEKEFGEMYVEGVGRPGLPIRLMVALHYLKHLYNVGDETVVERFLENPYWQYLCGYEYFQHRLPCDPTSLVKWRQRLGAAGIEQLLKETIEVAKRTKQLKDSDISNVNVDTTVAEKAIAFPTDARLYYKMIRRLAGEAKKLGVKLRQSYLRVSKRALRKQSQYAQAKQMKRARRETNRLRTMLGRVMRDIIRKSVNPTDKLIDLLFIAECIHTQQKTDKHKIYSVHATEVECIAKGKAHKQYEFGAKVSIVTTSNNDFVVGIDAVAVNSYDGATLKPAIAQVEKLTGQKPKQAFVDKGYKGSHYHPQGVDVYISGRRNLPTKLSALLKNRSAIEPVIGHLKHDHGMERNHLFGRVGDRINAMLSGAAFNLRKLLRAFYFCQIYRLLLLIKLNCNTAKLRSAI
jgi:IS5 family transposase